MAVTLSERAREALNKAYGPVFSKDEDLKRHLSETNYALLFSVGDLASITLLKMGLRPHLLIYDGKIERSSTDVSLIEEYEVPEVIVNNSPGEISDESWHAVESIIEELSKFNFNYVKNLNSDPNSDPKPKKVFVKGEEDLLAVPCVIYAPLKSMVLYGLRKKGIVAMLVTAELKENVKKLIGSRG